MSVVNPTHNIQRQSVAGMEGMWTKMFDPPTASPPTPDRLNPTNPVPEVMAAAGFLKGPSIPHTVTRDLLHGLDIPTWDGLKKLKFFLIRDSDNPNANGTYPGPTCRVPRGVIFHATTQGHGPPPHTIHWHGIEPTPMNDGVGHCSMEIGNYIYQFQPNFIGTYFAHCHRNTPQHFDFGLFGLLLIEPPDAYFATQVDPRIPIGHCRDGKRRIAANLRGTPLAALQDNFNSLDAPDPWTGDPRLKFATDPHAMTVPYDVEALWAPDDRDSTWSDMAPNAFVTFPKQGGTPGVDDHFHENPGAKGFFALNQWNADYWFVTGVPIPAHKGGTAAIPPGIVVPAGLNSGVTGSQVSIEAKVGQTVLVRCLDSAYNNMDVRFPMDVVITAWDGRALGVPPYGAYNHADPIPANTTVHMSVARRCDVLFKADKPMNAFAEIDFLDTRNGTGTGNQKIILCTARIPINITAATATNQPTTTKPADGQPVAGQGGVNEAALTDILTKIAGPLWTVGATSVLVVDATRLEGFPMVGDPVNVRGQVQADGSILASRIRAVNLATAAKPKTADAPKPSGTETRFTGIVNGTGTTMWLIGTTPVAVDANTKIRDNPALGLMAEVRGYQQKDGIVLATQIRNLGKGGVGGGVSQVRFEATVEDIAPTSWVIGGFTVTVNSSTKIKDNPREGDLVEVRAAQQADRTLLATEIRNMTKAATGGGGTSGGSSSSGSSGSSSGSSGSGSSSSGSGSSSSGSGSGSSGSGSGSSGSGSSGSGGGGGSGSSGGGSSGSGSDSSGSGSSGSGGGGGGGGSGSGSGGSGGGGGGSGGHGSDD